MRQGPMLSFVLFLLLAGFAALPRAYCQEGAIEGQVTWDGNQKPIDDAKVGLIMTSYIAETNENGIYRIGNIQPGEYELRVFLLGYESDPKKIRVDSGLKKVNFKVDTISRELEAVKFESRNESNFGLRHMQEVEGAGIYSGKKTEVVELDELTANKATNKSRQIYNKVAGIHVWESDGAGIQLDVGSRGLNPKRTANFNTRQNGYDISADALGYPEAYYTPPTEALQQIKVVRGAASLQYGPQFGGMINFKLKEPPKDDPFRIKTRQTMGSFGLFNTYNSISGTLKNGDIEYYTAYKFKRGNGWRPNSGFRTHTGIGSFEYNVNDDLSFKVEFTKMNNIAQQPGGLTDGMFEEDPSQSVRERNWFKVDWNMASFEMDYQFDSQWELNSRFFGLLGSRSSLGFLGRINRIDHGQERQLLKDEYKNFGNETRLLYDYQINGRTNTFLIGSRVYQGFTKRRQGFGTDRKDADFSFINQDDLQHSKYKFPSSNLAIFAENKFAVTEDLLITPGLRFEHIKTAADGFFNFTIEDLAGNQIFEEKIRESKSRVRNFVLLGLGLSYKPKPYLEVYANYSENYRAISFNDMRVINPNLRVDKNLQDESGFTSDLGVRGSIDNILTYDLSAFGLSYQNKIGSVLKVDQELFRPYRYRTNVADAWHYGVEGYAEAGLLQLLNPKERNNQVSVFTNFSWLNATYINSNEPGIEGNEVEYAPPLQFTTGLNFELGNFRASYQYTFTDQHYSDATNAEQTPSAIQGTIPSYHVMDLSLGYQFKFLTLEGGVNNLTNNSYFTRRATGYPGPGIIPAQPRSFYVTLGAKF